MEHSQLCLSVITINKKAINKLKVLIPTDFSDEANNAVHYAIDFLSKRKADLYFLNTFISPHGGSGMLISIDQILAKDSSKELNKLKRRLEHKNAFEGLTYNVISESGYLESAIDKFNQIHRFDLIIMGTKVESGFSGALFGSTASKVIAQSKIPVLTIPEPVKFEGINTVLLTTDGKPFNNSMVVTLIKKMVESYPDSLQVIHVETPLSKTKLESIKTNIASLGKSLNIDDQKLLRTSGESFVEGIDQYLSDNKVDMLLMVPRKASFLEKFMNISDTRDVTHQIKIPLWTFCD